MIQTWLVACETGDVHIPVHATGDGYRVTGGPRRATERDAVLAYAAFHSMAVREIRGPGELTTAEAAAAAVTAETARCVEDAKAVAQEFTHEGELMQAYDDKAIRAEARLRAVSAVGASRVADRIAMRAAAEFVAKAAPQ